MGLILFNNTPVVKSSHVIWREENTIMTLVNRLCKKSIESGMKGCLYYVLLKVTCPDQSAVQSIEKTTSSLIKCLWFKRISCTVILPKYSWSRNRGMHATESCEIRSFFQLFIAFLSLEKNSNSKLDWLTVNKKHKTEVSHEGRWCQKENTLKAWEAVLLSVNRIHLVLQNYVFGLQERW